MISALVPLLLEASLRALLAAVAVWAGLRMLGVGNVLVQKITWGLVLLAALALPLLPRWQVLPASVAFRLPALAPLTTVPQRAVQPTPPAPAIAVPPAAFQNDASRDPAPVITTGQFDTVGDTTSAAAVPAASPTPFSAVAPARVAADAPTGQATGKSGISRIGLAAMAWCLYLGVFTALLLRLVLGLAAALRLWLTATPIPADAHPDHVAPNGFAHLRSSSRVASPVNIGSGIVLPADYTDWDEEKLRIVLAHERSHIRQGDFYLQTLSALYAALFWFSPLGWWLKRKLYELGEAISDRAGLEQAASRSSYAQILLEFAALPRPTLTGVAMARTSHLSQRIERLLNESSFRHAFAGAGRRALLAVLLVPVALLTATALVRVEASVQTAPQAAATTGQSAPEQVTDQSAPTPPQPPAAAQTPEAVAPSSGESAPQPQPAAAPSPAPRAPGADQNAMPAPPAPVIVPDGGPLTIVVPRIDGLSLPKMSIVIPKIDSIALPKMSIAIPKIDIKPTPAITLRIPKSDLATMRSAFEFDGMRMRPILYADDGEQYALVGDPGSHVRYMGGWDGEHKADIEKARQVAHGHFLWFQHDDKSYIIDDPAIVAQIEAMEKPMDDLGDQMRALGKQMRDLGQQQRDAGSQMRAVNVPTPDLSKEIADLNAALATLQSKQGSTINQKDLGDLQRQMGHIMGQLGALQGKLGAEEGQIGDTMGKFGKQQGELGGQMGALGKQMGQISRENHEKIEGIIKDSLSNGKAKPVQ